MAIVFISHKLGEVLEIADRVTVLRRGKKIDTVPTEGATEQSLARLMVGRDVLLRVDKPAAKPGAPVLEVEDLRVLDDRGLEAVRGALAGGARRRDRGARRRRRQRPAGAGRGDRRPARARSGHIRVAGEDVTGRGVRATSDAGVAHIAEDRQLRGLVLDFTLAENLALREYRSRRCRKRGLLSISNMQPRARASSRGVRRARPRRRLPASSLSGGNQQKVCIAREIARIRSS